MTKEITPLEHKTPTVKSEKQRQKQNITRPSVGGFSSFLSPSQQRLGISAIEEGDQKATPP